MDVRLLGPFEVVVDGTPVALSARRPRALLAALVLRAGTPVSVDSLVDAVWDGNAPESAPSLLRLYVSQLRRVLPPGRLVTRAPGYLIELEDGECDADRFEQLLADGRRALEEGNARLARSLYGRALDLWRGDALADFATSDFATDEAAHLDDLRLACVEGRFEADLRLGRHAAVLEDLERLVAEHPLHERLRGQLMLALYRSGRQADALGSYRAGRAVLVDELGLEPSAELRELERRILDQDPTLEVREEGGDEPFRVPPPQTETVGREDVLAALERELLDPVTRLVTLAGPGGIGKTRIAVELAQRLGGRLTDGAVLVDLAPLHDASLLLPAIARVLRLRESGSARWPELVAHDLRGRELLLVLDNFEHLVDGAAPVTSLLDAAPRLTVLATSRRPLRLAAERVVDVAPLEPAAARELLGARTAAAGASVDAESDELGEVCDRLEGLPLAIELAAPWFRTLPPSELLSLLDSRLELLAGGSRDAPERHRTMRSAIDWSFELLDPAEQRLLGRLSLFHGGFTTEAMLDVGGDDGSVGRLDALVSASLVRSAAGRHRLLEVVREYAEALPSADDEGRDAHALHFVRLAETAEGELAGAEQSAWLERLERDRDNLREALEWLAARGERELELRLAAALGRFWYMRGYLSEGLERLRRAVGDAPAEDATVAKALRSSSALALLRGDYQCAREAAERALAIYRRLGDESGVVRSLSNLGAILPALGELDVAAETLDECVRAAESLGDERLTALACNNRGDVALLQGDLEMAAAQFERSLVLLRSLDDTANVARALYNLGAVAVEQRRDDEAVALLQESLDLSDRVDDDEDVAWCLIGLAAVAAERGDVADAAAMLGFTAALLERLGATTKPVEERLFAKTRDRLRGALGAAELEVALAAGARLPRADAVGLGLAVGSPS
jgi:predicted ATPase/DNA-binding SARP family transcriptional activator